MLSQVRDYFRSRVSESNPNLKEWTDALNTENVPESLVDKSYHINISNFSGVDKNDSIISYSVPCVVTVWRKGFKDTIGAHDFLLNEANCLILNASQFLKINASENIRSVNPQSILVEGIDGSNDNIMKATITFNCVLFYNV